MKHRITIFLPVAILLGLSISATGQGDDKVDVFTSVSNNASYECKRLELGAPVESIPPEYPAEARAIRLGGAVRVIVAIGEDGIVIEVKDAVGPGLLLEPSKTAALKTRFTSSLCDGVAVPVEGVLTFNFVLLSLTDVYIVPTSLDDFRDVGQSSPYYEAILTLTENYKLAFGYADGNYHSNAPMTKGDFAHYLRLTLDLLQQRAEIAQKIPRDIDLYFPANPLKIKTFDEIGDLDKRKPYAESVGFLISKYDIALTDKNRKFKGKLPLTQNEVIEYWSLIFGQDAVPVNFAPIKDGDRIMTRGEFALFLQESLYVLTYKVLP